MSHPDFEGPGAADAGDHSLFPRPVTETSPDNHGHDLSEQRKGSELRSWEQILEAYGPGAYQLVAQQGKTYRYPAWSEKVTLPGRQTLANKEQVRSARRRGKV